MASLRPRGADDLGLKRALSDWLMPLLVAAMVFLAALALAAAVAASAMAAHWRGGPGALLTVQVPRPDAPATGAASASRGEAVADWLAHRPNLTARRLSRRDLETLLQPWLGQVTPAPAAGASARAMPDIALDLPAVFELTDRVQADQDAPALAASLTAIAPGTLVERNGVWFDRLATLGASLRACAALALLLVGSVAAAVVAMATRAGLAARRESIEIVHGLGATDSLIAHRFAARITTLTFLGALGGLVPAIPVLLALAVLMAPFKPDQAGMVLSHGAGLDPSRPGAFLMALAGLLPAALWASLPCLAISVAVIGWVSTQATVRHWLARLP